MPLVVLIVHNHEGMSRPSWPGWPGPLHTEMVCPPEDGHQSQY